MPFGVHTHLPFLIMSHALFDVLSVRYMDGRPVESVGADDALQKSIQDHLVRLFNARQGVLPHLPDYGLPDLTAVYQEMPYSISDLVGAVKKTVEKYEPRLRRVRIIPLPADESDFVIKLEISGTTSSGASVKYQTMFVSGGAARVAQGKIKVASYA